MSITRQEATERVKREGGLPEEMWEAYHVMFYMRWCYTKLKTMISDHDFPYHKMGTTKGKNYFRRSEIDEWAADHFFYHCRLIHEGLVISVWRISE